jgi:hypothetical protein
MSVQSGGMNPLRLATQAPNEPWLDQVFSAKAVQQGGVVRRAVRDVEREVGRARFMQAVAARGFHLIECGGQFVVICRTSDLVVHL